MVVIALSPPYYPSIHNDEFQNLPDGVDSLTDYLIGIAENRWQEAYKKKNYIMEALSVPVINIGPWGKDLHKFTERVYKLDLYERTPALLASAIDYVLGEL
jgi:arginine utilization protein RocB